MISLPGKSQVSLAIAFAIGTLLVFLPACTYRKVVQLDSHRITVSRHGFQKKFSVTERPSEPRFEYAGISTDGKGLRVLIEGDTVTINGEPGKLRPGDSVLISDDGVAVNSLDYGESAKYLRANYSTEETAVRN